MKVKINIFSQKHKTLTDPIHPIWIPHSYLDTIEASKVQQSVLEHAPVTRGQNKAIPVEPLGIFRVVLHDLVIEHVTHWGASHGETRVAGIGLLDGVDGEEADRVDGFLHERDVGGGLLGGLNRNGGAHMGSAATEGEGRCGRGGAE